MATYKQKFNRLHGQPLNKENSIEEVAKLSGYNLEGLKIIFQKGQGAYFSNSESVRKNVKSPAQWGMARVYASVNPTSKASKVDASHLTRVK